MTRVLCAISGLEFTTDHFTKSLYLTSREYYHPIFSVPPTRLLTLLDRWIDQDLSREENYLLYLALWNSSGLMEFRSPAIQTALTASIVAQNLPRLAKMVEVINSLGPQTVSEKFHLPTFVITTDTQDLEASHEWIKIWENCYSDYQNNYVTATAADKITKTESILERYIKDKTKDISTYARQLANWASDVGKFDIHANYVVLNEFDKPELMSAYWKRIIVACAKSESIWDFPEVDLQDLYEHCEQEIEHGSIFAHTLMSLLQSGISRRKSFTDLGSIDLGNGLFTFKILDADASVEDANKLACIMDAPLSPPRESDYPNKLAFLKAKMNYRMAQEYKDKLAINAEVAIKLSNKITVEDL